FVKTKIVDEITDAVTDWTRIVITYDSIQATRTNTAVDVSNAQKIHFLIREFLRSNVSEKVAAELRIFTVDA
ncbi:triosephosphate isomerase-like protein, partial [Leptotrombidium deliense]